MTKSTNDIFETLQQMAESLAEGRDMDYPNEALPVGTWVRSERLGRLGFITDAFYGDKDLDNQNIIVYTLLLIPNRNKFSPSKGGADQYYLTNEYEYEVTAYLMMNPINVANLMLELGGRMLK